jgi:methyl-accepting chemotaxis protein
MLRDILSGARGMSPVVLVVLIAWALLSVLFLTGTLLAARSIDRSVKVIGPNVEEIGTEGGFIKQAKSIADKTVVIRKAALPLNASAVRTERIARRGIDPKLKSILGKVGQINQVAGEINTTVLSIGGTVNGIFGNASSINASVTSISSKGRSILNSAQEINGSARNILGSLSGILSRVNSIDRAVATIVGQANTILDVAPQIGTDLHSVLGLVGTGHGSNIHGHANAIDCSPLLVTPLVSATQGLPAPLNDLLRPVIGRLATGGPPSIYCGK